MKCENCGKEFEGRAGAKTCSPKCRVTLSRKKPVSVTDSVISVTDKPISVTKTEISVTDNDPLTVPPLRASQEWYASQEYSNLIEELELKPISQLEKEGYFVPAWKYQGYKKKPNIGAIFGGIRTV